MSHDHDDEMCVKEFGNSMFPGMYYCGKIACFLGYRYDCGQIIACFLGYILLWKNSLFPGIYHCGKTVCFL